VRARIALGGEISFGPVARGHAMNRWLAVAISVTGILLAPKYLPAQSPESPVRVEAKVERDEIVDVLKRDDKIGAAIKDKKVRWSTILRYQVKPAGADEPHTIIEAYLYVYDERTTIRATYDMSAHTLKKLEFLGVYPTPLAEEEIKEAKKLAHDKNADVKALMEKYHDRELQFDMLVPVVSERRRPLYGKRLVALIVRPKRHPREAVAVTVNLTDETVERD
jgi:hypothetical protein